MALVVVGCAWSADVWAASAPPTPSRAAIQAAQTPPANEYVGDDTCTTCHAQTLKGTKHGVAADPHTPAAQHGCESCHGPGKAHVDDDNKGHINRFPKMSPRDASAVCTTCHNKGDHALWAGSTHDSRSLSCITCHSVHSPVVAKAQLKATDQFAMCGTCHRVQVQKTQRTSHMPLREGKMECTSCHNPHGTPNDKMLLQTSVNQNCYTCHAEKRGPFLWEHAPVRENCLNCHDAHGTINEKMLKVKTPLLCQQCHQTSSHPGPAYPAQSRYAFNQGCLHCHPAVHGSVHPSGNRFFR